MTPLNGFRLMSGHRLISTQAGILVLIKVPVGTAECLRVNRSGVKARFGGPRPLRKLAKT